MKNFISITAFIGFILVGSTPSYCQLFSNDIAEQLYTSGDYSMAVPYLERQKLKSNSTEVSYRLGFSHYQLKDFQKAITYLVKIVDAVDAPTDTRLLLAKSYIQEGNYTSAMALAQTNSDLAHIKAICEYAQNPENQVDNGFVLTDTRFTLSGLHFAGSASGNSFYLSEPAPKTDAIDRSISSNYSIKKVDLDESGKLMDERSDVDLMNRFNIGSPFIFANGTKLFYCENDAEKKVSKERKFDDQQISTEGIVTLNIYMADINASSISNVQSLPFNSREFSTMHPFFDEKNHRLYFASDMPNGFGGFDLYYSELKNGNFSEPINLGSTVNSAGNELYPSLFRDSILFFASDGHLGFGGADIFLSAGSKASWSALKNAGNQLNSSADDFGVNFTKGRLAYFASNRESTPGTDYLYSFYFPLKEFNGSGIAYDELTREPIANSAVNIYENGIVVATIPTDEKGYWEYDRFNEESSFNLVASKANYQDDSKELQLKENQANLDFYLGKLDFYLNPVAEVNTIMEFKDILFEYNKADLLPESKVILDRVYDYVVKNKVSIELSAHTDSRGTNSYNEVLSGKRAKSAIEYLIGKGLAKSQVTSVGFGEAQLKNKCKDGVSCSEELHQENRRVEVKITGKL